MSGDVALVVVSLVLTIFASAAVLARGVSRLVVVRHVGLEDGLVLLALLCSVTLATLFCIECFGNAAVDADDINVRALQISWTSSLTTNLGIPLAKTAIILQYIQFFIRPRFQHASWILLAAVGVGGVISVVVSLVSCTPVQSFWRISDRERCIDIDLFSVLSASWDLVTNILLLMMPMMAVVRWAQPKAERWAFTGLYFMGFVAILASAARLYGSCMGSLMLSVGEDVSTWMSTVVELNFLILCASLPAVDALVDRCCPGFWACYSDSGRRASHSRTWMKLAGRDCASPDVELAAPCEQSRKSSVHLAAPLPAPPEVPTMVSVTTNNRGSAHPGALVAIPEDVPAGGKPLAPRTWLRGSRGLFERTSQPASK